MPINTLRELHQSPDFRDLPPEEQVRAFEIVAAKDADYQQLPPVEQTRARRMVLGGLPRAIERRQFGEYMAPELAGNEPREPGAIERAWDSSVAGLGQTVEAIKKTPEIYGRLIEQGPTAVMEAVSGRPDLLTEVTTPLAQASAQSLVGQLGPVRGVGLLAGGAPALGAAESFVEGVEQTTGVPLPEILRETVLGAAEAVGGGAFASRFPGPAAELLGTGAAEPVPPRVPRNYIPERTFYQQPGEVQGGLMRRPPGPVLDQIAAAGEPGYVPPPPRPAAGTVPLEQDAAQQALEQTVRENPRMVAPVPEDARAQVVPPPQKSPEQIAQEAYQQGKMDQLNAQLAELDLRTRHLVKGARTAPESVMPGPLRSEAAGAPPVAGRGVRPPPEPELPAPPTAPQRAPVQPAASAQAKADQLLKGFGEVPPELQAEIDRLGPAPAGKEYIYRFEGPTQKKGGDWFTTDPGEAASYANTPEARGQGRVRIETVDSAKLDDINRQLGREPSMRGEFQLPAEDNPAKKILTKLVGDPAELPPSLGARAEAAIAELTRMRDDGLIEMNAGVPLKGKQLKAAAETGAAILYNLARGGVKTITKKKLYVPFARAMAAEFPELNGARGQIFDESLKMLQDLDAKLPNGLTPSGAKHELVTDLGIPTGAHEWYERGMPEAVDVLTERYGSREEAIRVLRLYAATSQRVTTGVAAREALATMDAIHNHLPRSQWPKLSGIAAKMRTAKRDELLNEGTVTGPKIGDFDTSIADAAEGRVPSESVVDTHVYRAHGVPAGEGVKSPPVAARRLIKESDKRLGAEIGLSPGQYQAGYWGPVTDPAFGDISHLPTAKRAPSASRLSLPEELILEAERAGKTSFKIDYEAAARAHAQTGGSTTHPKLGNLAGQEAYAVSIFPGQTHYQSTPFTGADILKYRVKYGKVLRSDDDISIGTWFDEKNNRHVLDLVVTPRDREHALHLAEKYGQDAIYDLKNRKEIRTFSGREIPESELPPIAERMAQFRESEKSAQRIRLRHFSPEPIDEITTEHFGEGALSNAEKRRGAEPSIHGYLGDVPPEKVVLDRAQYEIGFDLPEGTKLYDIGKDPEALVSKHNGDLAAVEQELKGRGMAMQNTGFDDPTLKSIVKHYGSRPALWIKKIDEASRQAYLALIRQRGARPAGTVIGSLGGGLNDFAEDLPLLAKIGALKIARGAADAASFAAEMSKEFPQYKDQMDEIFRASQNVFVKTVTMGPRAQVGNVGEMKGPILHEPISSRAVKASEELFLTGKVKRDPQRLISDQVMELISDEKVSMPEIDRVLKSNGLTFTEFGEQMFRPAVTDAARRMQALSALQRKINLLNRTPGSEARRELAQLLRMRAQFQEMAAKNPVLSLLQRLDRARRGLMVTQLATSMRNVISQVGRVGINAFDEAIQSGLQKGVKAAGGTVGDEIHALDGFEIVGRLFQNNKTLTDQILKDYPLLNHRMFNTYASDISSAAKAKSFKLKGVDEALNGIDSAVDVLNVVNRGQEFLFRRAAFVATVAQKARAKGFSLYKAGAEDLAKLTRDDIEAGVDKALELTFAQNPKTDFGRAFLKVFSQPGVTLITPFPRFMQNALKFYFDFSPLGFSRLLSPAELKAIAGGNTKTLSRAIIGTGMLGAALELRHSKFAGEKWYEVKVGDKTFDMRPFNPFAAYLLVAHLYDRSKKMGGADLAVSKMERQDLSRAVLQNFFSANLRAGAGREILEAVTTGFTDMGAMKWTKQLAGETVGGMLMPLQTVFDVMAEYDDELAKRRETRTEPFTGPIKAKIPWKAKELPEYESPTREATPRKISPTLRQATGLTVVEPKNAIEKELDRLQFSYRQITSPTGDPDADVLIRKNMGPIVEQLGGVVEMPFYGRLSDPMKKYVLKTLLAGSRKVARQAAAAEDPERFMGLKLERTPEELLEETPELKELARELKGE